MMQPSVLMFTYPFPPAQSAGIFRTLRFIRYLPDYGWRPLVLTVLPESLHHKRIDPALNESIPSGVLVERTAVLRPFTKASERIKTLLGRQEEQATSSEKAVYAEVSTAPLQSDSVWHQWIKRLVSLIQEPFSIPDAQVGWTIPAVTRALRLIRIYRPQILYSTGPPHSSHLIALAVKVLTGIPLVIDLRDPWARSDFSRHQSVLGERLQPWLEELCVKHADCVILNTPSLRTQFFQIYPNALHHKFVAIPNGYDPELRRRIEAFLRDQAGVAANGCLRLCHSGTIYGQRKLQPLVSAIKLLVEAGQSVVFEQVGTVAPEPNLMTYIREHGLDKSIAFFGLQPHDVTLQRMAAADALVLIQPGTAVQVPGKLFEMMLFRKPIVALADSGNTADLIEKYDLGVVADPGDPQAITRAIRHALEKKRHDAVWTTALEVFNGRRLTGSLAERLDDVCARRRSPKSLSGS